MRLLVHKDVQDLTGLLTALIDALHLYDHQRPEVNRSLLLLLDRTAASYKERGRTERESQAASLKAELNTALRGVNPITLEKPSGRRHEMQNTIVFRLLQALESQLRGDLQQATALLQRAQEIVSQIVVAAIQKGLIDDDDIRATTAQEAIQELWRSIGSDAEVALAQKQVLLLVSAFDIYLLIDRVFSALREIGN